MMDHNYKYIGRRIPKLDARDKVTGRYHCLADEKYSDCLYGVLLLSPYANAKVVSLDASAALALTGVKVLTYKDAPDAKYNSGEWYPGQKDWPDETVLTGHARYVGDRIGLVLAASEAEAREALKLVKVEYEQLPAVVDLETAAEKAALLHEDGRKEFVGRLSFGDVEEAFAKAAFVETDTVYTPKVHHAAIETHCVLALPKPGGVIEIHTPSQVVFGVQHAAAQVLPLPLSKIHVVKANMGGTFGGKQESCFEPLCAWAAWKLRRPVFINTNREETILGTKTRAAVLGTVSTALDEKGLILGRKFDVTLDAGAYLTGGKKVMMAMGKKASRLYRLPAMLFEGRTVRTSTTPCGACRGYGSPQIHTITEVHTDLLCRRRGWDPVEFRLKNLMREFDEDPAGASNIGRARVAACLEQGAAAFGWNERRTPVTSADGRFVTAAGFACCTHGNGYYKTVYHDYTQMSLRILEDGSAILRTPLHELGSGTTTEMAQIVAEVTGIGMDKITVTEGDTFTSGYDTGCQASRVIYVCGECARLTAEAAVRKLCEEASKLYGADAVLADGKLRVGGKEVEIGEAVTQIMLKNRVSIDVDVAYAPEKNPASFAVHFAEVRIDKLTGLVKVVKYLAVHDLGQAINRSFVEGQIYGGVQMGIGMALLEDLPYDKDGRPAVRNFDKYHMVNAPDMPEVETLLIEDEEPGGPFGAKSVGEIVTVPVAAAVVNAVNRGLGTSLTQLPLTPARIAAAAQK